MSPVRQRPELVYVEPSGVAAFRRLGKQLQLYEKCPELINILFILQLL